MMANLVGEMDEDFWDKPRREQVLLLIIGMNEANVSQKEIARLMRVSEALVTRIKHYLQEHPNDVFGPAGRPSPIGAVFLQMINFIHGELSQRHSVTMGVLLEYLSDQHSVFVDRTTLLQYMKRNGFAYVSALPTKDVRVDVDREALKTLYTTTLPEVLEGVHPALIFNMDEMGAERYADKKRVNVLIPSRMEHRDGMEVGVPRTVNRCTLLGCMGLDGTRVKPAIITNNKTLNSLIFESGYSPEKLTVYSTTNSFITSDVFFQWLTDIFIPHVEATRETLRRRLGTFNERAVLILDGCSSHTSERFWQFLESKNITMMFLVPHSSHLTQPLDLGVFGLVQRVMRDSATYNMNVEELNDALDDVLDGVVPDQAVPPAPPSRTRKGPC